MVDMHVLKTLPCNLKLFFLWELVTQNQSCEIPALDISSEVDTTTRMCREINFTFYQQMEITRC